jgi:hypothetical protein
VTPPPAAPFLDPTTQEWAFDSSGLINAAIATGFLDVIIRNFRGRAHLVTEVLVNELDLGPTGREVRSRPWFQEHTIVGPEDLARMAALRQRWSSRPGRDRGEAAIITQAERTGWTVVFDDGTAYRTAREMGIRTTRTPQLLVSTVRANWWTSRQAWEAYRVLCASGQRRLGPMPWSSWEQFDELCHTYHFDP